MNLFYKSVSKSLVSIWLMFAVSVSQVIAESDDPYRLSKDVQPTSQSISLDLDPDKTNFSGSTTIDLSVVRDVSSIGLYWLGPNVTSIQLKSRETVRTLSATAKAYDIHQLADGQTIAKGDYQLELIFDAEFSTDALGLYRTEYKGKSYLFTQFETLYARRVFPIFDEPDFKIPYQLTLTVPQGLEVATNTPVKSEQQNGDKKTVEFEASPPMSSYLLALTVGPLDKTPITGLSVPGVIYSPEGTGSETGFAVKHTPNILQTLEEYFGIDYPYKKLDFVAVPDYAFGAMENVGLVTYRTELLLVGDDARSNTASNSLSVIAHELAHMWYGDLVTMKWWDDLWLNEAFASWMAAKVMDSEYPQYQSDLNLPQVGAFGEDALAATKAIRKEVKTDKEITDGLGLNYSKGHAILNMFEQHVGEKNFQLAIQKYMKDFSWKNAVADDLWQAISTQSGQNLSDVSATYLDQPGFALVTFKDNGDIEQQRYSNHGSNVKPQEWQVPISIKYKKGNEILTKAILLKDGDTKLKESADWEWFFPALNGNGYYRWQIPADKYAALLKDLSSLSNREKMALLSNSSGLLDAGEISIGEHLSMLTELAKDENAIVSLNVIEELKLIGEQNVDQSNEAAFSNYITQVLTPWYEKIGSTTKKSDGDDVLTLRPRLLRTLGQLGDNPELNKELTALAHEYLSGESEVDGNLGREALRIAAMIDKGDLVKLYYKSYKDTQSATLKSNIMSALYFREDAAINFSLGQSLLDDIPAGDKTSQLGGAFYSNKEQAVLYSWLEENFDKYIKAIPQNYVSYMPFIMSPGCKQENVDRLSAFFKDKGDEYKDALAKTLEAENNCLALKQREQNAFNEFLSAYR